MKIPRTMNFIDLNGHGGPGVLFLAAGDVPIPGPGELLVKVAAAGVNGPDLLQRKGYYPPPAGASPVLGLELSGTVVGTGKNTHRFKAGDRICALAPGGAYAEYVVVPELHALPIPKGITMLEAAGIAETFFTVWTNVFERGNLCNGETILIHGGSGGIGTTAIQLASAIGATVFTTAVGEESAAILTELGAHRVIDFEVEDFVSVVLEETKNIGVNMVVDIVGAAYIERNLQVAAVEGRMIQISWLSGTTVNANLMALTLKRLTWTGSTLRARSNADKAGIAHVLETKVWPLFESGKIKPIVHQWFSLHEAAEAHAMMEEQKHIGKIILVVDTAQLG